jgi:orotate phosphoribosyltransferase
MDYAKESLKKHYEWRGKLEMTPRAAVDTSEALSLAYTPGVAEPCLEIQKDIDKSYELTRRWNTVAVVTDGTAVLGTCVAEELTKTGFRTINAHQSIYVLEPEYSAASQMIFRDNIQPMIRGKHVLVLMASVTTGFTAKRSIEAIRYYGGQVAGVAAIYRAVDQVEGYPVRSVYSIQDLPDYASYDYRDCPYCKQGIKIDALVNSFGFSAL